MEPLIVANWKCNPTTLKKAKFLFNSVKEGIRKIKNAKVVVCPPFPYLTNFSSENYINLGAQDCFWKNSGAFTGAVSPLMLKDLGVKYVIVGHSERRKYFGETDEMINKKIKAILAVKLKPILCIGEIKVQREKKETEKILKTQLKLALKNLSFVTSRQPLIIAYEPVWAIGTGNPCRIKDAKAVNLFIKKTLYQLTNSTNHLILYGGSVNSKNAKDYIKEAGFHGLLVGGASLNIREFIKIIQTTYLSPKMLQI